MLPDRGPGDTQFTDNLFTKDRRGIHCVQYALLRTKLIGLKYAVEDNIRNTLKVRF